MKRRGAFLLGAGPLSSAEWWGVGAVQEGEGEGGLVRHLKSLIIPRASAQ